MSFRLGKGAGRGTCDVCWSSIYQVILSLQLVGKAHYYIIIIVIIIIIIIIKLLLILLLQTIVMFHSSESIQ